jgi:phosphoribosylamine--glycine ligase
MAITDGETIVMLDPARDHKTAYDGDAGPNTGGMGAYCPSPLDPALAAQIEHQVLIPIVHAMNREGRPYQGVLYAGLMLTEEGPKVLEFNVRFGDPEAQVILPRLKTDLVEIALRTCDRTLAELGDVEFDPDPAVVVVLASEGYPLEPQVGREISGLDAASEVERVTIYHSGTALLDGRWVTQGGRVLGIMGRGADLEEARSRAYTACNEIRFRGMHLRRDIARKKE